MSAEKAGNILSASGISFIGREGALFSDVTFGLCRGEKAALIGRNGTGKSTLLSIIAKKIQPDSGSVVVSNSAQVSYLPQNPCFDKDDTILSHIFKSESAKLSVIREYEELCATMEGGITESLKKRYDELTLRMEESSLWSYEAQVRSVLNVLGITRLDARMGELSGGMVKKVCLAQVLVDESDIILLDEPTNHLDIQTIYWLQNYLAETKRAVLMVTHDRYFLDAVCQNIYELNRKHVKLYVGNYSEYLEKKELEAEIEANTERRIESVLRFERDWLRRGPCARGTKAKARIEHDMALINREKFSDEKGFTFEVLGRRLGGKVLSLKNISKSYSKNLSAPVIQNFSYTFTAGEKIGVFGANGSGKTTLLNIIASAISPDAGSVEKGVNTVIGYYQQNAFFTEAELSRSVLEYAQEHSDVMTLNDGTVLSASLFLERFGFSGKIQHSPLSSLSGGEKKRLFLVRLLLLNPNFLLLDEPTNDFDIFTMNILEQFLQSFKGCLIVVSHDRYFMDKVCDTLFIMEEDGGISGYVGKCSEYIAYQKILQKEQEESKKPIQSAKIAPEPPLAKKKLTFKEKREFEELEALIGKKEALQKELEQKMASADYAESLAAGKEYKILMEELEASYARWEELSAYLA